MSPDLLWYCSNPSYEKIDHSKAKKKKKKKSYNNNPPANTKNTRVWFISRQITTTSHEPNHHKKVKCECVKTEERTNENGENDCEVVKNLFLI